MYFDEFYILSTLFVYSKNYEKDYIFEQTEIPKDLVEGRR